MLTEENRTKLDGIVQQMTQNNESEQDVQSVVNDFKQKYSTQGVQAPDNTSGAWFPASPSDTPLEAGLKTAGNVIPSTIKTGVGMVESTVGIPGQMWESLKTANDAGNIWNDADKMYHKNLEDVVKEIADKKAKGVSTVSAERFLRSLQDNPPENRGMALLKSVPGAIVDTATGIIPFLKPALKGDLGGVREEITNNPVGNILPLLAGVEGGVRGLSNRGYISPKAPAAIDTAISKTGQLVTKPVAAAAEWTKGKVGETGAFAVSQATGLEPSTIKTIEQNKLAFTPREMAKVDRISIANEVGSRLNERIEALSETGAEYGPIRASQTPIRVEPHDLTRIMQETTGLTMEVTKLKASEEGVIQMDPHPQGIAKLKSGPDSIIRDQGDVGRLQSVYNRYQPLFEAGELSPNQYLNLRADLAKAAEYDSKMGKSKPVADAADRMRGELNSKYRTQVQGLENLDKQFESQISELKELRKGLIDKDGNLTDSSISKIANATGKGKYLILDRLEQISPGITKKIQILKAVEDIQNAGGPKVGTYVRSFSKPAIFAALMTGHIGLAVLALTEAILSSPGAAVPLIKAYGASAEVMAGVLVKLKEVLNPNLTQERNIPLLPRVRPTAETISQIAEDINSGGTTYNLLNKSKTTTGHAVSVFPNRGVIIDGSVTVSHVKDFIRNNMDIFSKGGFNLGGWKDGGKGYLDISASVKDRAQAIKLGKQFNQKAISDLDAISRGDWDNAFVDTGGTGEAISGMGDKQIWDILKQNGIE